jgi:hypothetical protein
VAAAGCGFGIFPVTMTGVQTLAAMKNAAAALLVWAGMATLAPAPALAAGPFDGLTGSWSGDGTKERLRCRVQYVQKNEDNLQQALRCASDSYKFEINAYFDNVNGRIVGTWSELVQNVRGTVTGTVRGGRIEGDLQGPGFIAQLVVVTRGDRQTVSIEADLEEIRSVAIEVRKAAQ